MVHYSNNGIYSILWLADALCLPLLLTTGFFMGCFGWFFCMLTSYGALSTMPYLDSKELSLSQNESCLPAPTWPQNYETSGRSQAPLSSLFHCDPRSFLPWIFPGKGQYLSHCLTGKKPATARPFSTATHSLHRFALSKWAVRKMPVFHIFPRNSPAMIYSLGLKARKGSMPTPIYDSVLFPQISSYNLVFDLRVPFRLTVHHGDG